jgi:hypothetical protein
MREILALAPYYLNSRTPRVRITFAYCTFSYLLYDYVLFVLILGRFGMAKVYRKYAKDYNLYVLQHEANVARRGLWSARSPIPAFGMAPPAKANVIHVRPNFAIRDPAVLRSLSPF